LSYDVCHPLIARVPFLFAATNWHDNFTRFGEVRATF
jgi:hypothetical protein